MAGAEQDWGSPTCHSSSALLGVHGEQHCITQPNSFDSVFPLVGIAISGEVQWSSFIFNIHGPIVVLLRIELGKLDFPYQM